MDRSLHAPLFRVWNLPEAERAVGQQIWHALGSVSGHLREFEHCLDVFSVATANKDAADQRVAAGNMDAFDVSARFSSWRFVAAKAAAVTIFNFCDAIDWFNRLAGLAPTLLAAADADSLKSMRQKREANFRFQPNARHGVAHASEFQIKGKADFAGPFSHNGVEAGEGSTFTLGASLDAATFSIPYANQMVSLEVSVDTLEKMRDVARDFFAGLRPVQERFHSGPQPE